MNVLALAIFSCDGEALGRGCTEPVLQFRALAYHCFLAHELPQVIVAIAFGTCAGQRLGGDDIAGLMEKPIGQWREFARHFYDFLCNHTTKKCCHRRQFKLTRSANKGKRKGGKEGRKIAPFKRSEYVRGPTTIPLPGDFLHDLLFQWDAFPEDLMDFLGLFKNLRNGS